jgi:hypothetical protein
MRNRKTNERFCDSWNVLFRQNVVMCTDGLRFRRILSIGLIVLVFPKQQTIQKMKIIPTKIYWVGGSLKCLKWTKKGCEYYKTLNW